MSTDSKLPETAYNDAEVALAVRATAELYRNCRRCIPKDMLLPDFESRFMSWYLLVHNWCELLNTGAWGEGPIRLSFNYTPGPNDPPEYFSPNVFGHNRGASHENVHSCASNMRRDAAAAAAMSSGDGANPKPAQIDLPNICHCNVCHRTMTREEFHSYPEQNLRNVELFNKCGKLHTSLKVCRDFILGNCQRPETCCFLHVVDDNLIIRKGRVPICQGALRSNCRREFCRYLHIPLEILNEARQRRKTYRSRTTSRSNVKHLPETPEEMSSASSSSEEDETSVSIS